MADPRLPFYKWFPRDYLSDENVAVMSLEEEGAYRRLLDYCWIQGSIPDDIEKLARLVRVGPAKMEELWPALEPCFEEDGGRWIHPRMSRDRTQAINRKKKLSEAGRRGRKKQLESGQARATPRPGPGKEDEDVENSRNGGRSAESKDPGATPDSDSGHPRAYTETETETETETTPTGGGEKPDRAREAPPPPTGDHLASLKSYLDGHPGVDEVATMVEDPGRWAMGLLGLYGPQGTEERLMSGVPPDERPDVLATALIRYATDAEEWDSKFFRGFVRKAIAERKRDREPPPRHWGNETERDQARMEAYHQREVKRGEEARDDAAQEKSREIAELLEWFDEQPEDVQEEIEADAEERVRVMAVGLGPGKKPPDIMIRSAQFEAIRTAREGGDG